MKRWRRLFSLALSLCLISLLALPVKAADLSGDGTGSGQEGDPTGAPGEDVESETPAGSGEKAYKYKIRLFSGKQGTIAGEEVAKWECAYGDKITIDLSTVSLNNDSKDKYYIRGIRESGKDNSGAKGNADAEGDGAKLSFTVTCDQDYVVAYGIRGELTHYRVEFVDADGRELAKPRVFEGNVGDKPVVAYQYIEGYQPQAYNLTKTLIFEEEDALKENVLRFVYTPGAAPGTIVTEGGVTVISTVTDLGGGGGGVAPGGEVIPEEETPLAPGPEEILDLDEEETPLAGRNGFPVYGNASLLGIPLPVVIVAGLAILGTGFWYFKTYRKKKGQEET